ncbi:MAG: M55 family metallopeptidase [Anaerolineales bacterium]|nr:M55 family metallopeptidase [Anaerolineales bacterium]
MKILIAVDMEGISGVVHWDQVMPGNAEYPRFQAIMTEDVNAAVSGAFSGGADEVLVTDGHNNGRNILIEELDRRARLNSSNASPLAMLQGIDSGVDGVIFVGYHARVGTQNAILEHTWSSRRVAGLWINQQPIGEIGLNAALSGHFGAPLLMISGDQSACAEARALVEGIESVVVKQASGRMAAECLPLGVAQWEIEAAAQRAVERLRGGQAPKPLRLETPLHMALDLISSEMADRAALLPGAQRQGRRIEYDAADMPTLYAAFRCAVALASY